MPQQQQQRQQQQGGVPWWEQGKPQGPGQEGERRGEWIFHQGQWLRGGNIKDDWARGYKHFDKVKIENRLRDVKRCLICPQAAEWMYDTNDEYVFCSKKCADALDDISECLPVKNSMTLK